MKKYFLAEQLKTKRTFSSKLVVIAPLFTMFMAYILSSTAFQAAAYNWWYVMILPATLSIWCASIATQERKSQFRNVLALPINLRQLWSGKIQVVVTWLFIANLLMFTGCTLLGFVTQTYVTIQDAAIGCILLTLVLLWQIPFMLWMGSKLGYLSTVFIGFFANVIFSLYIFSERTLFYLNPYSIPARIVSPFFRVRPNGIPIIGEDPLLSTDNFGIALTICLILTVIITVLTSRWFDKREG
ncbi:ABC-2 type transport system permease protein [Natranaerovirga hydrolytica]|uniref:ABC-2 type transport system permease protein n=1 Tax=Natranaerovirga hydrolytica TaxID=680378 RepID=A0A4R1MKM0_9FIRM|nr:lantibiotic immunity ABC transporter MutE/EpiE family permease subunit [Natranaerovirga hydrolytica]TCK92590.1 ABC-2 type transport system permease protein [Natranaerovirga hydrolytica]